MSTLQRTVLVAGILLVIIVSIVRPPTKIAVVENPEYKLYPAYRITKSIPAYISQTVPDNNTIIRYDAVIALSTAVLFFVVKPSRKNEVKDNSEK